MQKRTEKISKREMNSGITGRYQSKYVVILRKTNLVEVHEVRDLVLCHGLEETVLPDQVEHVLVAQLEQDGHGLVVLALG